jgi:DNA (cytosine-5)-methyltransferase 1
MRCEQTSKKKSCERLQGFPDDWTEGVSDTQRYKTLGNAVTVNVVRDIMLKLL